MAVNVVMLGPPGAGKGTQAEQLARAHAIPRVSTGDILREAVQADTPLGRKARAVMEAGQLVGDDIVIGIVRERLAKPDAAGGFVLDGFPRTPAQAEALEAMLEGRGPLVVLQLDVPIEALVRRLSGRRVCSACGTTAAPEGAGDRCAACGGALVQRPDDAEAVVRERLQVYERRTRPLIEYYRGRPTFVTVDGNRPPAVVTESVRAAVAGASASAPRPSVG
jgi:adenylate kinase